MLRRPLDTGLHPRGARVSPLGWAADSLMVAELDAPQGSDVEGRHLALMTSPDGPQDEWTFRILLRDVPQDLDDSASPST